MQRVHAGQTYSAAIDAVYRHLGDDAERLLKGRVRIINVWKPIANPVAHNPSLSQIAVSSTLRIWYLLEYLFRSRGDVRYNPM